MTMKTKETLNNIPTKYKKLREFLMQAAVTYAEMVAENEMSIHLRLNGLTFNVKVNFESGKTTFTEYVVYGENSRRNEYDKFEKSIEKLQFEVVDLQEINGFNFLHDFAIDSSKFTQTRLVKLSHLLNEFNDAQR